MLGGDIFHNLYASRNIIRVIRSGECRTHGREFV